MKIKLCFLLCLCFFVTGCNYSQNDVFENETNIQTPLFTSTLSDDTKFEMAKEFILSKRSDVANLDSFRLISINSISNSREELIMDYSFDAKDVLYTYRFFVHFDKDLISQYQLRLESNKHEISIEQPLVNDTVSNPFIFSATLRSQNIEKIQVIDFITEEIYQTKTVSKKNTENDISIRFTLNSDQSQSIEQLGIIITNSQNHKILSYPIILGSSR